MREIPTCFVDGEPCEVVGWFAGHLAEGESLEGLRGLLPCQRCREGEQTVQGLPGTRLGRHERRILMEAPSTGEEPAHLEPESDTRSADEALRRAIRKLDDSGLVERSWSGGKKHEKRSRMVVRRTIPGDWVAFFLKDALRDGGPIRWAEQLEEIRERVRERNPGILAYEFRIRLEGFVRECHGEARRFPGLLETPDDARRVEEARMGKRAAEAAMAAMDAAGDRQWELFRTLAERLKEDRPLSVERPLQSNLFPDSESEKDGV